MGRKFIAAILSLTILFSSNVGSFSELKRSVCAAVEKNAPINRPILGGKTIELAEKREKDIFVSKDLTNKLEYIFNFKEPEKIVPLLKKIYFEPVVEVEKEIDKFNKDNKFSIKNLLFKLFAYYELIAYPVFGSMACYLGALFLTKSFYVSINLKYFSFDVCNKSTRFKEFLNILFALLGAMSSLKYRYDLLIKGKEKKLCKLQSLTEKLAQATARKNNCLDSVRVFLDELKLITKDSNTHLLEKIISDSDCIAYKHEDPEEGGCCSIYFKKSGTKNIKLTEEDKNTLRQNLNKLAKDLESLLNEEM